jgi:hypothetical protein
MDADPYDSVNHLTPSHQCALGLASVGYIIIALFRMACLERLYSDFKPITSGQVM